jgi:hypothetical protein
MDDKVKLMTSICTGAAAPARAELLDGRPAASGDHTVHLPELGNEKTLVFQLPIFVAKILISARAVTNGFWVSRKSAGRPAPAQYFSTCRAGAKPRYSAALCYRSEGSQRDNWYACRRIH